MGLLVFFKLLLSSIAFGAGNHLDADMRFFCMNSFDVILEGISSTKSFSALFTFRKLWFLSLKKFKELFN